jgi:hypothetical protein
VYKYPTASSRGGFRDVQLLDGVRFLDAAASRRSGLNMTQKDGQDGLRATD